LVSVNSVIVRTPGMIIDPESDYVTYKEKRIIHIGSFVYILLNKPAGVVCTAQDERHRPTVLDIIKSGSRIFPVGRLDINTTGLILLTNDGELSNRLTHPRFGIEKVYRVVLHKPLHPLDEKRLEQGIKIEKDEVVSARIAVISKTGTVVKVTVHEGKKNMIKRMFNTMGYVVTLLDRIQIGFLTKRKLPLGGWRYLTHKEIHQLYVAAETP